MYENRKEHILIDLKKWDSIGFNEIAKGDTILMLQNDAHRTFFFEGTALSWEDRHDWWEMSGDWVAGESTTGRMKVTFYRKQFELPNTPMSIIEGESRYTSGKSRRFILLEGGGWVSAVDGSKALPDALLANFKNWRIVHEGFKPSGR